jgi:hypothetical protein
MKVNISLVFLGAVAASAIALPAQAATVVNKLTSGPFTGAAYSIDALDVTGYGTYDVTFKYGTYNNVFAGDPNSLANALAKPLGDAIVGVLAPSNQVISTFANFISDGPRTSFFIPKALLQQPNGNDVFVECLTSTDTCTPRERGVNQRADDKVLYATWKTTTTPPGNVPQAPTPALIPGLLGMGLAAMRKKQQAAVVAQEA